MPYLGGRINRVIVEVGGKREKEAEGICVLLAGTTGDRNILHSGTRGGISISG